MQRPDGRRGGGPKPLATLVAKLTKPVLGRQGFAEAAAVAEWRAIVGPMLGERTAPERIAFPGPARSGGTLYVRVADGGLALELQHLAPLVIERLNTYFGYRAVERLVPVRGAVVSPRRRERPAPAPLAEADERRLAETLAGVEDEGLRASLERLGRSLLAERPGERR